MTPEDERLTDSIRAVFEGVVADQAIAAIERLSAEVNVKEQAFRSAQKRAETWGKELAALRKQIAEAQTVAVRCDDCEVTLLKTQNAVLVQALDQALVTSHLGTFEPGDDPFNAIKVLMDQAQSIGAYFERERLKDLLAALQAQLDTAK